MKAENIHTLVSLLQTSNAPETIAYVQQKTAQLGIDIAQLYRALEMRDQYVEAFRNEGYANTASIVHSHHFFEIIYCCSNHAAEYLIGSDRYLLQRGDLIVIPPGISHASLLPSGEREPYKGYGLWLSLEFFNDFRSRFPFFEDYYELTPFLIRTSGTVWESLETYFRAAVSESELKTPGWEPSVIGWAMLLATNIFRAVSDVPPLISLKPKLLDVILAYVEKHMAEKITLDDIAQRFWTSRSTINKLFNTKMGMSFYKYVTERRLAEAKNMLMENIPMEEIGAKVGFSDYSVFYRAFKQRYGISPNQYKKMQQPNS